MWFWNRDRPRERGRAHVPFDESTLPRTKFLTVAEAVEEGLLLTEYASRMAVKNRFLIRVLAGHEPWELARGQGIARDILQSLARESDTDADNLDRLIEKFSDNPASARDAHGYSYDDLPNMEHRRDVSREVARRLREQSADEAFLIELVGTARRDAWREVASNIEHNLDLENIPVDADYLKHREQRMRRLIAEDLAALSSRSTEELAPAEYGDL